MGGKPKIAMIGAGRLASALARELRRGGYRIREIISRNTASSLRKARALARVTDSRACTLRNARLDADLIWFCVPDREIANAARDFALAGGWEGKLAFHASGSLTSDALDPLRRRGAAVASVHPLMTFVERSVPPLQGIPFCVEGDAKAVRVARRVVRDLRGEAFTVGRHHKALYHAWGTFLSPLLVAALITAEQVARAAGLSSVDARKKMLPIVRQTLRNYAALGPARSFSGPLVRGDAAIVGGHLRVLKQLPSAREVYVALTRVSLRYLPVHNRRALQSLLRM